MKDTKILFDVLDLIIKLVTVVVVVAEYVHKRRDKPD